MTTASQLFADRIINLSITGPLVRIELGALQLAGANEKSPTYVPTQTLVMPLDGFVSSFSMLEQAMKKLAETGVVRTRDEVHAPTA